MVFNWIIFKTWDHSIVEPKIIVLDISLLSYNLIISIWNYFKVNTELNGAHKWALRLYACTMVTVLTSSNVIKVVSK